MEISSVSGMQMGFNLSSIRQNTSEDSDDFATEMSAKFLEDNDSDGDGLVSAAEFDGDEDLFDSIDEDGDGSLSQEELLNDAKAKIAEMQANFENNVPGDTTSLSSLADDGTQISASASGQQSSGESSEGESGGSSSSTTDAADANGDGIVTQEELLVYLQSTIGTTAAENASATSSNDGQELLEQANARPESVSAMQGRAADAYESMQQSTFGESQDASFYTPGRMPQEGLNMTV